jgi:hypothetical protein
MKFYKRFASRIERPIILTPAPVGMAFLLYSENLVLPWRDHQWPRVEYPEC